VFVHMDFTVANVSSGKFVIPGSSKSQYSAENLKFGTLWENQTQGIASPV
jgi:hypothetical protein